MDELQELRLTAFQYAMDILARPEISMHLRNNSGDIFDLSDRIFRYLKCGDMQDGETMINE